MRVSDFIAEHLKKIGTRKVFMLSGGGMMHLIDAVATANLPYICNHHEQASSMAAEGYARMNYELGVCYATSGPGATNILTGLVAAWQDSSPILFLTGQSKRSQTIRLAKTKGLRQFGTFEVDIIPMVESVTKYVHFLDDPESVRYHLEKAIHLATTGRPGPVLIDIPLDVQGALINPEKLLGYTPPLASTIDETICTEILKKLQQAKRPLMLVGHGVRCANAVTKLRDLVDKIEIPVVTTQLAKDALYYDHPLFVGHSGPKGDRPGNFAVQTADLILFIGSSLHSQTIGYEVPLFAPDAYKIQVDSDQAVLDRGDVPVQKKIKMDVGIFVNALQKIAVSTKKHHVWRERCAAWKEKFAVKNEPHKLTGDINFYEFAEALSTQLAGNEAIVTDAGSAFYAMGQAFRIKKNQRYIVTGGSGAMGYAMPAATGMAAAQPETPIVAVTGDGALQTNIHEFQTWQHNKPNIKLFIINNNGYASIRNTQKGFFNGQLIGASPDSGVTLPDLEKIVGAYGLHYVAIDDRNDLEKIIKKVMSMNGPVVVGIKAQAEQQIIPTVSSSRLPNGSLVSNPLHKMSPLLSEQDLLLALDGLLTEKSQNQMVS